MKDGGIWRMRKKDGWKEGNDLFNEVLNTFLLTVIWRQTYGEGPFR